MSSKEKLQAQIEMARSQVATLRAQSVPAQTVTAEEGKRNEQAKA
jgi:hypothetical protein